MARDRSDPTTLPREAAGALSRTTEAQPFVMDHSPQRSVRVVIAADDPSHGRELADSLERSGLELVAEVATGVSAMRALETNPPDVVVLDLSGPGSHGLAAIRRLADQLPQTPVMVLSGSADERDVTDAIIAGASGYMLNDRPVDEIMAGIRAAAAGQSPVSPRIAAMLVRRLRETAGPDEDTSGERTSRNGLGGSGRRGPRWLADRLARRW